MTELPLRPPRVRALPDACYREVLPAPLDGVRWVHRNPNLAAQFGLPDAWADDNALSLLSGSRVHAEVQPLATVYSGHQFGLWAGQLGDGRALLLGEVADQNGALHEWQLKGSGKTPYSRFADGRAVLRSSIREYLCSEAVHALGIPTTRALALTAADTPVRREQIETAAVLTRTAPTFLRFGHFEHFYHRGETAVAQALADWLIQWHFPECSGSQNPYAALFAEICAKSADLVAQWQAVGFCHGVLNTDNMSVLGLTIDYGPFGFLEDFNRRHVCNRSDREGRYAYHRQPYIVHWNLSRLAVCFSGWVAAEALQDILDAFPERFQAAYTELMRRKLGLQQHDGGDAELIADLAAVLHETRADYTLFMRRLAGLTPEHYNPPPADLALLLPDGENQAVRQWLNRYRRRLRQENRPHEHKAAAMNALNPLYIPRNYLLHQAIVQAQAGDYREVGRLFDCWQTPFREQPQYADLALPAQEGQKDMAVSCSS